MFLPLRIAFRYIRSKRTPSVIHVISGIALAGIAIATAALIVVLSVFNGFTEVVSEQFNKFNPSILVEPLSGKTFHLDAHFAKQLRQVHGVEAITPRVQDNMLVLHDGKQMITMVKGIDTCYNRIHHIDRILINGQYRVEEKSSVPYACVGAGVAYSLGLPMQEYSALLPSLSFTVPRRGKIRSFQPHDLFLTQSAYNGGVFSLRSETEDHYVLLPISMVRELLQYDHNEVNGLEIHLAANTSSAKVRKTIRQMVGDTLAVKDRQEQQEIYYRIVRYEKTGVYLILSFILFIATFNLVGSLLLLIMNKQDDIKVLRSMGANRHFVRKIFFSSGMLLSCFGGLLGLFLGSLFCFLQQTFGLIKLGGDSYIIDHFPVAMQLGDFLTVFVLVLLIGSISIGSAVRRIK